MKELAAVVLFAFLMGMAYVIGWLIHEGRKRYGPWQVEEGNIGGGYRVGVQKKYSPRTFQTIGVIDHGTEDFEQQLYELRAQAKERAMALNLKR